MAWRADLMAVGRCWVVEIVNDGGLGIGVVVVGGLMRTRAVLLLGEVISVVVEMVEWGDLDRRRLFSRLGGDDVKEWLVSGAASL